MEMGKGTGFLVIVVAGLLFLQASSRVAEAQTLRVGYYNQTCRAVESIVADEVQKAASVDRSILASLLRLHFHDCFVNGCDASVLLDAGDGQAEKNAQPNQSLRGYELVDRIKARLEATCKETVTCADILAFAARDSVKLSGGLGYAVPAGRPDGTVSRASQANDNLPPSNQRNVDALAQFFYRKGLSLDDMVVLSGAHTVGAARCGTFGYRLTSDRDKGMDAGYRNGLRNRCGFNPGNRAPLDDGSQFAFDSSYFANVLNNRTAIESDAALNSPRTAAKVRQWRDNPDWFKSSFAAAMVKMGAIRGTNPGKVRVSCRRVRT